MSHKPLSPTAKQEALERALKAGLGTTPQACDGANGAKKPGA